MPTAARPPAELALTPKIRLLRKLGAGGMGTVWAAHHAVLGAEVAVKLFADEGSGDELLKRVAREAKAASRVTSPHVVRVIDYGAASDGRPYLVMELLEGGDLGAYLDQHGPMPPSKLLPLVRQIVHALAKAHEQGIVHRDVKPSNVFLCDGSDPPFVKLLDFGIAKLPRGEVTATTTHNAGAGTPTCMSPEQLVGDDAIDHRSDIWALGVLVYRALTGRAPYQGETLGALALAIHNRPPASMRSLVPALPAAVDTWFARACAVEREDRFADVVHALRALEAALGDAHEDTPASGITLSSAGAAIAKVQRSPVDVTETRSPSRRRGGLTALLVASGVAALAIGARASKPRAPVAASAEHAPPVATPTPSPVGLTVARVVASSTPVAPAPEPIAAPTARASAAAPQPRHATAPRRAPAHEAASAPAPSTAPAASAAAPVAGDAPAYTDEFPHERH